MEKSLDYQTQIRLREEYLVYLKNLMTTDHRYSFEEFVKRYFN